MEKWARRESQVILGHTVVHGAVVEDLGRSHRLFGTVSVVIGYSCSVVAAFLSHRVSEIVPDPVSAPPQVTSVLNVCALTCSAHRSERSYDMRSLFGLLVALCVGSHARLGREDLNLRPQVL